MEQIDFVDSPGKGNNTRRNTEKKSSAPKRSLPPREGYQRLNVELPKDLHKRLKLKAIYEERTVTAIVMDAVNYYLHKS